MKTIIKTLLTIFIFFSLINFAVAEQYYVSELMKITMRTGPGVSHKVISMVSSGDILTMLEYTKEWSRVKAPNGKEGWVLTRFITKNRPLSLIVDELRKKNQELSSILETVKAENQALSGTREKLINLEKTYNILKNKSSNFLDMEQKYNEANLQQEEQKKRIEVLESQLKNEDMVWFLSGAGVFMVGIILGVSTKKEKRNSLL
ncbi:MAG: TIGR04211 family SH3 domain-containing protein [Desulfamplus sp.]|nr:TIGR04211 family SH3 domain-containing protein [Desulfamplus sp.]